MHRYVYIIQLRIVNMYFYLLCRKCLALSILPVVRRDLEEFVVYWNTHHIRPSSTAFCPSGRPDDLFAMPHIYGKLCNVTLYMYTWTHYMIVQVDRTVCNHSTGAFSTMQWGTQDNFLHHLMRISLMHAIHL